MDHDKYGVTGNILSRARLMMKGVRALMNDIYRSATYITFGSLLLVLENYNKENIVFRNVP